MCKVNSVSILPTRNYCIHGFTTLAIDLGLHGSWQQITWRLSEYNRNVANKIKICFHGSWPKNFYSQRFDYTLIIFFRQRNVAKFFLFATFQLYSEDYQSIIETLQIKIFFAFTVVGKNFLFVTFRLYSDNLQATWRRLSEYNLLQVAWRLSEYNRNVANKIFLPTTMKSKIYRQCRICNRQ